MLEKTLEIMKTLSENKENISNLKNSFNSDSEVLKNESAIVKETYLNYNFNNSLDTIRNLGWDVKDDITLETAIQGKKSLIEKIKDLFKQKKVLIENKNVRITDHDIPDNINSGAIANEIFYGDYGFITQFVNKDKIEPNDIIGNYKNYIEQIEKYFNKHLKTSKLFETSNLIGNSSNFIGHKFDEKIELLNGKSLSELYDFDLNKIKIVDKTSGINVIEYRYLFLAFEPKASIYLIKYIKTGDLFICNISYKYTAMKSNLYSHITLNLTKEDIIKIITEKTFDDKWFSMPENSDIYEGTSKTKKFLSQVDSLISPDIKFDKPLLNKLGNTDFDYWDEHEVEDEFSVDKNIEIKRYLYNLTFDNYYDNVEQGHHGNILAYNFYWNIVANIIDLFKKKKLGI